jgi:hypothetical protein
VRRKRGIYVLKKKLVKYIVFGFRALIAPSQID